MSIDLVWYTRCPVAAAFGVVTARGWLDEELSGEGMIARSLAVSSDPAVRESHFGQTQSNLFRHGGNIPPIMARSRGADVRVIGMSWTDHAELVLAMPVSGIRAAADLRGRRLALPRRARDGFDFHRATAIRAWQSVLSVAGLGRDDVQWVEVVDDRAYGDDFTDSTDKRAALWDSRAMLGFQRVEALALERVALAEAADKARLSAETEALRNTLLASISHDLRTPLAVISAASSTLADASLRIDPQARRALVDSIGAKSREMEQLVSNVLDLMRFETGKVPLRLDWESLDDLVGLAVQRFEGPLQGRDVRIRIPGELPLVRVDAALIVQLLTNLFDNIVRHAPQGRVIEISAAVDADRVRVTMDDDGPGLPAGDPERLFAKFQRGKAESDVTGAGLGLAICRAIVEAHGGSIRAMNRPGGPGARFEFTLPTKDAGT